MSTYTIGETAERSGFSASALRYYEGIGLVDPPARTASGYRLYDDDTLARLIDPELVVRNSTAPSPGRTA